MHHPIIGIPCYSAERADTLRPLYGNNQSYVQAVLRAGGAPLLIPPAETSVYEAIAERLDGVLLSGGGDVDPRTYGEEPLPECGPPEIERDTAEIFFTRWALERRVPLLGICRGIQVLNVALGGTLYQDLPSQLPAAERHNYAPLDGSHLAHTLEVRPGSQFAEIVGTVSPRANSFHHQAVKELGAGIEIVAWTADRVAEAAEVPGHPFAVAVQYHPEALVPADEPSLRLFAAFVEACRARMALAEPAARPRLKVVGE
jgi:putative glutamine amidotransferase